MKNPSKIFTLSFFLYFSLPRAHDTHYKRYVGFQCIFMTRKLSSSLSIIFLPSHLYKNVDETFIIFISILFFLSRGNFFMMDEIEGEGKSMGNWYLNWIKCILVNNGNCEQKQKL